MTMTRQHKQYEPAFKLEVARMVVGRVLHPQGVRAFARRTWH